MTQLYELDAVSDKKDNGYGKILVDIRTDIRLAVALFESWIQIQEKYVK